MQTRSKYLKQLDDLDVSLADLAAKAVSDVRATSAAFGGDAESAASVTEGGKTSRRLRAAIEDGCLDIMLMQQPLVADDLRLVTGAFRVVSDLAHIEEMARDVAFLSQQIPAKTAASLAEQFQQAADQVAAMVEAAVAAFRASDEEAAQHVFSMDDAVDALYATSEDKVVELIRSGKGKAKHLPELLMVAKYYERMGDDAQRIASWAVFRVTGEHALHSTQEENAQE